TNPCSSSPCLNGGSCVKTSNSYNCTCRAAYNGDRCENVDFKPCDASPCRGNGACSQVTPAFTYTCYCANKGFYSDKYFDECLNKPCLNGGSCFNMDGEYRCKCAKGFCGKNCNSSEFFLVD
ncbi:predicted protein, partial [Nematostella vectensis]